MSDLQEFINQQKAKNSFFGTTTTATTAATSTTFSSINALRSKFTSSLDAFSLLRSTDDNDDNSDKQILTESAGKTSGQLPQFRNRKNGGAWFSSISNDESIFGMSRMQRIVAFFVSIGAAFICFGIAVILLPTVVVQARKFAALNTLGSIMLILRFVN
ncbi:unnamed protein product [Wuchereria bancrofti]|uniref:Vesicle transport protein n=1 Tax=Wuchereria bancrofti TaxID=6293 RepID=A0A3P7EGD4_WUCBA|nr:unnamed protein product [Wuchereria bancrofti]